jgi:uncharacterized membrane-anchored protein
MYQLLFWLYLTNAILLINHEIDSAYWQEWKLFKLPGGVTSFLLLHFPLLFLILYGLVQVNEQTTAGLVISLLLCFGGVFAFSIHNYFIRKGRHEFKTPVSSFILVAILAVSLVQTGVTVYLMVN